MMINRTGDSIAGQWQSELDLALELGTPPLLNLGAGQSGLDRLPALLAFRTLEEARKDLAPPVAIAGGTSAFWLLALLHARGASTPARSPGGTTAYSGPDPATHAAALGAMAPARSNFRRRGEVPPLFQPAFAPGDEAGAQPWETLPFAQAQASAAAGRDGWTAWVAVVAALTLLVIAVVAGAMG